MLMCKGGPLLKFWLTDIPRPKKSTFTFRRRWTYANLYHGKGSHRDRWGKHQSKRENQFLNIHREPVSEYPSMIMENGFLLSALILGKHHDPNPYPSASSSTPGFVTWSHRLLCTSLLRERRGRRRKKATGRNRSMCETCQQCCSDWSRAGVCKILSILAAAVCDNHNWEKMKGKCQR